jgi:hypothetical protein
VFRRPSQELERRLEAREQVGRLPEVAVGKGRERGRGEAAGCYPFAFTAGTWPTSMGWQGDNDKVQNMKIADKVANVVHEWEY